MADNPYLGLHCAFSSCWRSVTTTEAVRLALVDAVPLPGSAEPIEREIDISLCEDHFRLLTKDVHLRLSVRDVGMADWDRP